MTLSELMTIALRRCGLTASSSTYTQNSYKYLDVTSAMLMGESSNWYFRRKKGTITTVASDQDYDLASDFETPILAKNYTDNNKVNFRPLEWLEESDPDYSETGTVTDLIIGGINTSTSTIQVLAYPIPDSVQSIQYWYNQAFPEMGTSLDSTDLHKYCPRWFQNCLLFSLSAMFYSEKGDMQGAGTEFELMQKNLRIGFSVQSQINGDTTPRLGRKGYVNQSAVDQFTFDVREGSLS
jgi:hypothetical protein